jgi:hypothetical protein
MKLLEPLFVNAEQGKYDLYPKDRLKKNLVGRAISPAVGGRMSYVYFVSCSQPVRREEWMSADAFRYTRELAFAQTVRRSVDPWLDEVLKREYSATFVHGYADKDEATALFRRAFGNRLHVAINENLFSGAAYPVEAILIHFLAFALTGNESMVERLTPLVRLLPRAIPLGRHADREDTWDVLTA